MNDKACKASSPTRRYVAVCNKGDFTGFYFRSFTLPEEYRTFIWGEGTRKLENNCSAAAWYFLNVLNFVACIEGCITEEDYKNCTEQDDNKFALPECDTCCTSTPSGIPNCDGFCVKE